MYEVCVKSDFSAAHRLEGYPGNCANIHGHNWVVEVSVTDAKLDSSAMVIDFRTLKGHLHEILDRLDHQFLNELDEFKNAPPTTESVAKFIYDEMAKSCAPKKIKKVRVWETDRNSAAYYES